MVVLVLMINCQVSLNPKIGPEIPQTTSNPTAATKVTGCPDQWAQRWANRVNQLVRWEEVRAFTTKRLFA